MSVRPPMIVGIPHRMVFGLRSDAALTRQWSQQASQNVLVVAADWAVPTPTLTWLAHHIGNVLTDVTGAAVAGVVRAEEAMGLAHAIAARTAPPAPLTAVNPGETVFVRTLRRRERLEALDLSISLPIAYERALFDRVYKGVTDAVTKYFWPLPAFHVVRWLARAGVRPNAVTCVGIGLTAVAAYGFAVGAFTLALISAWIMTFLDTVDGKLARVTHTSSRIGDWLDHGTDWVHPPIWWACLALGLSRTHMLHPDIAWSGCAIIIGGYFAGRMSEAVFKKLFGFNQYIWQPFDAALRLVIARRNPNLIILTVGLATGGLGMAYLAVSIWTVLTIGLQLVRLGTAIGAQFKGQGIVTYLEQT